VAGDSSVLRSARSSLRVALPVAVVSLCVLGGYQLGKDMALRDNARDARAAQQDIRGND